VIYVVGKSDNLIAELKNLAGKKKVGNQDIEIKNTMAFDANINAHMICLTADVSKSLGDVIAKNKKGTLLISETTGGAKTGASINFVAVDNKLKFEYSKNNAVKTGLKTNDDFKALAISID